MRRRLLKFLSSALLLLCAATCVLWARNTGQGGEGVGMSLPPIAFGVFVQDGKVWAGFERYHGPKIGLLWVSKDHMIWSATSSALGFGVMKESKDTFLEAPCWFVIVVTAALGVWGIRRGQNRAAGSCYQCGYDMRATPARCPECGTIPVTMRP